MQAVSQNRSPWRRLCWASLLGGLAVAAGCGKPTEYPVEGVIQLKGEPLSSATVAFVSENESLIGAIARTDEAGHYRAEISVDRPGLEPGTYQVRVTTYEEGDEEMVPPIPTVPERVPRKYNEDSELTVEVKAEANTFDFDLR